MWAVAAVMPAVAAVMPAVAAVMRAVAAVMPVVAAVMRAVYKQFIVGAQDKCIVYTTKFITSLSQTTS